MPISSIHEINSIEWQDKGEFFVGALPLPQNYTMRFVAGCDRKGFPQTKMAFPYCYGEYEISLWCEGCIVPIEEFLGQVLLPKEVEYFSLSGEEVEYWVNHRVAFRLAALVKFVLSL